MGGGTGTPNDNTYTTGSGQVLKNVHDASQCVGEHCVVHNPSNHVMKDFPTYWRGDRGIMERICEHGVGHPDPDSPWPNESYQWIHGCDGCCREGGLAAILEDVRFADGEPYDDFIHDGHTPGDGYGPDVNPDTGDEAETFEP